MSDRAEFESAAEKRHPDRFSFMRDEGGDYCNELLEEMFWAWQAAREQEGSPSLSSIAQKKLDQMGATVHGVLVKNEAGAWAAVSDAGRVMWLDGFEGQAARAQGREAVAPFVLGNSYQTLAGEWVRFVKVHNEGSSYETMEDESGVNRYTNRPGDMGRVTASPVDYPGNVPPLYTHSSASVPDPDLQIIQERDYWEEKATELAEDVGKYLGIEVGEHSSANCPVQNAIDAVYNATPQPANCTPCSERLPTEADQDVCGQIWGWIDNKGAGGKWIRMSASEIKDMSENRAGPICRYWMPTGLKRPNPPAEGAE